MTTRADESIDRWLEALHSDDPFTSTRAAGEIRKAGESALVPLARALDKADGTRWFVIDRLLDGLLVGFLDHLESEYRALQLDRFELEELRRQHSEMAELEALRSRVAAWKAKIPDFEDKLRVWFDHRRLESRRAALGPGESLTPAETRALAALTRQLAEVRASVDEFDEKATAYERLARLASMETSLVRSLSEISVLRRKDLETRLEEREPRIDVILAQLDRIGRPALAALAARREGLPLQGATAESDLRSVVGVLYDSLLAAHLDAILEQDSERLFPEGAAFERERFHLAPLWVIAIDRASADGTDGTVRPVPANVARRARDILDRHVVRIVASLGGEAVVRERAALELYRLGARGLAALQRTRSTAGTSYEHAFLEDLLRWRISPRTYARVGIHFRDYSSLPFAARRRKVFQYARAAGEAAIPTLRAIIVDDELEKSVLVKYAAAKALLTHIGDRTGLRVLQHRFPGRALESPEISRDLFLLQGTAFMKSKDYRSAVEEFRKVLIEFPFDFDGNYHIAFAFLLLGEYERAIHYFEIARRIHPNDQLTLYNLACAYSLGEHPEEALDALDASVQAGFDDPDHIEKDPDLEALRDLPRYREIVESCRKKSE